MPSRTAALSIAAGLGATVAPAEDASVFRPLPATVTPATFLPENEISGDAHRVLPRIENDGLHNLYRIQSPFGIWEVLRTDMARTRIREIYAIRRLRQVDASGAVLEGVKEEGLETLDGAKTIIKDPVGAVKRIPKGAKRFVKRIRESIRGGKSAYEDAGFADGILGVTTARRQLSMSLGVNPYSSNPILNEELDRVAKHEGIAKRLAGLGLSAAVSGPAKDVLTGIGASQTLSTEMTTTNPTQLRINNRQRLMRVGVSEELADEFVRHKYLSPIHETLIADALASLGKDRRADRFVNVSLAAVNESDANHHQNLALLLARYHKARAPISEILVFGNMIAARDARQRLVIPLDVDYALWSEDLHRMASHFANTADRDPSLSHVVLFANGQFSERAAEQLSKFEVRPIGHAFR